MKESTATKTTRGVTKAKSTNGTQPTAVKKKGGYRPGAGRPKGARNRKTLAREALQAALPKASAEPVTALGRVGRNITPKSDESGLPSEKIIDIIDRCKSTNIKYFKYGTLEIEFLSTPLRENTVFKDAVDKTPCEAPAATGPTHIQHEIEVDSEAVEDARLARLMMDDPASFEQEIIDSHTGWVDA